MRRACARGEGSRRIELLPALAGGGAAGGPEQRRPRPAPRPPDRNDARRHGSSVPSATQPSLAARRGPNLPAAALRPLAGLPSSRRAEPRRSARSTRCRSPSPPPPPPRRRQEKEGSRMAARLTCPPAAAALSPRLLSHTSPFCCFCLPQPSPTAAAGGLERRRSLGEQKRLGVGEGHNQGERRGRRTPPAAGAAHRRPVWGRHCSGGGRGRSGSLAGARRTRPRCERPLWSRREGRAGEGATAATEPRCPPPTPVWG